VLARLGWSEPRHRPQPDRSAELRDLLAQRILILGGAMGTMVQ